MTAGLGVTDEPWDVGSVVAQAHSMTPSKNMLAFKAIFFPIVQFLKVLLIRTQGLIHASG
jgi:hypothetical protein